MTEDSIGATVYSYWQYYFYASFLNVLNEKAGDEQPWTMKKRLQIIDNYAFFDFYQKLIIKLSEEVQDDKMHLYQKLCKNGFASMSYSGPAWCQYNVARSFLETHKHLVEGLGKTDKATWTYGSIHFNEYPNQPWSMTPLKRFWHREVATGGNANTPGVSKYAMSRIGDEKVLKGTHTANYKQVIEFGREPSEDVNLMSIDTGMNGNLFGGNYFTMNEAHLEGRLKFVEQNFDNMEHDQFGHYKLYLAAPNKT